MIKQFDELLNYFVLTWTNVKITFLNMVINPTDKTNICFFHFHIRHGFVDMSILVILFLKFYTRGFPENVFGRIKTYNHLYYIPGKNCLILLCCLHQIIIKLIFTLTKGKPFLSKKFFRILDDPCYILRNKLKYVWLVIIY